MLNFLLTVTDFTCDISFSFLSVLKGRIVAVVS